MISSANVELDLSVATEEEISSINTCIDSMMETYGDLNMETSPTLFKTLKSKVTLISKPVITPTTPKTPPVIETPPIIIETTPPVVIEPAPATPSVVAKCNGTGTITSYLDFDKDGKGNPEISIEACETPTHYVSNNQDTNDYCKDDRCYVTSTSTERFCSNEEGCSLRGVLSKSHINRIHFDIDADSVKDLIIKPTKPFWITRNLEIYGCNKQRNKDACDKDQQIRIDASNMIAKGMNQSVTFSIKTAQDITEPNIVKIHDLIIKNNPVSAGIRVVHTNLHLNGRTLI